MSINHIDLSDKKIIFFDGDGTLWYPKKTKYTEKPHWIYKDKSIKDYRTQLTLIPTVFKTLKKLKKTGIITIVLSTNPHKKREAYKIINKTVKYLNLSKLFNEVHATRDYHASKGEYIIDILKKYNISKSKALMVGDNYLWDYKPAKIAGIDVLLIKSSYIKTDRRIKTIEKLSDILNYIKIPRNGRRIVVV